MSLALTQHVSRALITAVCLLVGPRTCLVLSHSACLVLGHSSRGGGGTWCWVTDLVSCLDTAAVTGGEPPPDPPRSRPLVLGHRFSLVLGHSSRAGGGNPPPGPPPSTTPPGAGSQILSRAETQQPCRGGETPPGPLLEHAPWYWVTDVFTYF